MRKKLGTLVAFVVGFIGITFIMLRDLLRVEARHSDTANREFDEKRAEAASRKAAVVVEEAKAAAVHAEVEKRLAEIDAYVASERKKDSVDLANDLIREG